MGPTFAALLGAFIGGILSVLASWVAQRVQSRSQWVVQEIKQRQRLYSNFIQASARCYADALEKNEPDPGMLATLYGEVGQMRLQSSPAVVTEARVIAHKILETYHDANRNKEEIRDLLESGSVDLFSRFGDACRAELDRLHPRAPARIQLKRPKVPIEAILETRRMDSHKSRQCG